MRYFPAHLVRDTRDLRSRGSVPATVPEGGRRSDGDPEPDGLPRRMSPWRAWRAPVLWAGLILVATTVPLPSQSLHASDLPLDKVVHFGLYLGLGWTVGRSLFLSGARGPGAFALAWLGGLLFAAADEAHQALVPTRVTSLADWTADAVGVTVGLLLVAVLMTRRHGEESAEGAEE